MVGGGFERCHGGVAWPATMLSPEIGNHRVWDVWDPYGGGVCGVVGFRVVGVDAIKPVGGCAIGVVGCVAKEGGEIVFYIA